MLKFLSPIAWLFGYVLRFIFNTIGCNSYILTILLFTLFIRLITFPFSLKNQKSQMDRAKLAPRLERLQKKYAGDQQKLQKKQQELYEKEGVSMTGGCLPMLVSLVVLMGVLADIYQPLQYLSQVETGAIDAAITVMVDESASDTATATANHKISSKDAVSGSYYRELRLLAVKDYVAEDGSQDNPAAIKDALAVYYAGDDDLTYETATATVQAQVDDTWEQMESVSNQLTLGSVSLLENPWQGLSQINLLWIIALISGLSALGSAVLSMHYSKQGAPQPSDPSQKQAQGCTNSTMYVMPLFSLYITFVVPGAVGIYWVFSNLIAMVQTVVLNAIYSPAKARAQAQKEYDERRARKAEDKKRLAEARRAEELARQEEEQAERAEAAKKAAGAKKKKDVAPSKNPNKAKKRAQAEEADAEIVEAEEPAAAPETAPEADAPETEA